MSLMGDEVAGSIHPGKAVREDCLKAEGLTVSAAAEKLVVARTTLDRVLNGRGGISANMALRFETVGWSNVEFWMRYQASYDLENARMRARKRAESVVAETCQASARKQTRDGATVLRGGTRSSKYSSSGSGRIETMAPAASSLSRAFSPLLWPACFRVVFVLGAWENGPIDLEER